MNIRHLESKNTRINSQTINGFSVKAFLYQDAAGGTQYGSSKLDFSKVAIKAILNRDGVDHILFQDNLKLIGLASNLNTRGQLAFYSDHDHYVNLGAGKSLCTFNIPLGGCIRISGNDSIYLEVTAQDGVFAAGYLASSYIEIKPLKAVGYETFVPSIKSINIQAGTTSETYSLGDNVIRAVLLNYDQTDFTTPIVQNLNFASDRYNEGLTYFDLINMKNMSFPKLPVNLSVEDSTLFESDQSFTLIDFHMRFNQVVLDMQFNGGSVNASKNYLVYWTYRTDWTTLDKAIKLAEKHQAAETDSIPASSAK
jgi:hypothetical protein